MARIAKKAAVKKAATKKVATKKASRKTTVKKAGRKASAKKAPAKKRANSLASANKAVAVARKKVEAAHKVLTRAVTAWEKASDRLTKAEAKAGLKSSAL